MPRLSPDEYDLNSEREQALERRTIKDARDSAVYERESRAAFKVAIKNYCSDDDSERLLLAAGLTTVSLDDHPDSSTLAKREMDVAQ